MKMLDLALALGGKESGAGYLAKCPAHADTNPSLSLSEVSGTVLFKCHAGCSQEAVIDALKRRNLWKENAGGKQIARIYDYTDADGKLLYQKLRYEPKAFAQRRPDGYGGWIYKLDGVAQVLYRLPEIVKAIRDGKPVFIVEGEKDVETLKALMLVATTNSGGAGKWTDSLSEHFKGAVEVLILPDNDEPGHRHAQQVAESLYKHDIPAKIVKLPDLPEKGDVSDWWWHGGDTEELLKLCCEAPIWSPGCDAPISMPARTPSCDWANSDSFGEPMFFEDQKTEDLGSDFLPSWVKNYIDALSGQTQTPLSMASMLALAVLAACLQKRYEISPYSDEYTEPLSLWVLVVAPPASRKSAVLEALRDPISEWELEQEQLLAPKIEEQKTQRDISLRRIEELTRRASKAEK